MLVREWEDLPDAIKKESVRKYYNTLNKKRLSLLNKRVFDIILAILIFIILSPIFIIISIAIKIDSKGPIMFRQVRVTQYGKQFKIFKFRTMVKDAEQLGGQITTKNDSRVTRVGKILRKLRLDEIPQLFNIIAGDMSFVGTRPEVVKYVEKYSDEMMATLLLPAGVTSKASIHYKDEEKLLVNANDVDEIYLKDILPKKMKYNLRGIEEFSFLGEIRIMFGTVLAVTKKERSRERNF
ncbi:sugar transferase [Neobacillus sp. SAB-20_R2A]|uniref:sugar transferase n=1 Tax=Neobacillus sp. SAB-20_R2A TaxID=3120519 RepID=UPI003C6E509A